MKRAADGRLSGGGEAGLGEREGGAAESGAALPGGPSQVRETKETGKDGWCKDGL